MSHSQEIIANHKANRPHWVEVDAEYYEDCFDAMPPVHYLTNGYVMGEAYSHTDEGNTLYFCFLRVMDCDRNWRHLAKIATLSQWREIYRTATYESLVEAPTYSDGDQP